MHLPPEILEKIVFYTGYDKRIVLSLYIKKKLGKCLTEDSWVPFASDGNLYGIRWLYVHKMEGYSTEMAAQRLSSFYMKTVVRDVRQLQWMM
jgi:hypothetical protein